MDRLYLGLPMWTTIRRKVENGERLTPEEGVHLLAEAPLLELGALAQRGARPQDRSPARHLRHRHQSQLHQRLHGRLPLLRVLPQARRQRAGRLHPRRRRRDADDGGRRPRCGATTVLLQGGLNPEIPWEFYPTIVREARRRYPRHHAALLLGARDPPDGRGLAGSRSAACCDALLRGRPAHAAGRRRRDPGARACASGSRSRRAGPRRGSTCIASRAPRRHALDRHHDVRPRRDRRRDRRAPRLRPRAAGRDARLHRVRAVVLQARQHADGVEGEARRRRVALLPRARRRRGSTSTTSTTSRRRGSARARRPGRSRCSSAPTTSAARCSRRTSTSRPGT